MKLNNIFFAGVLLAATIVSSEASSGGGETPPGSPGALLGVMSPMSPITRLAVGGDSGRAVARPRASLDPLSPTIMRSLPAKAATTALGARALAVDAAGRLKTMALKDLASYTKDKKDSLDDAITLLMGATGTDSLRSKLEAALDVERPVEEALEDALNHVPSFVGQIEQMFTAWRKAIISDFRTETHPWSKNLSALCLAVAERVRPESVGRTIPDVMTTEIAKIKVAIDTSFTGQFSATEIERLMIEALKTRYELVASSIPAPAEIGDELPTFDW